MNAIELASERLREVGWTEPDEPTRSTWVEAATAFARSYGVDFSTNVMLWPREMGLGPHRVYLASDHPRARFWEGVVVLVSQESQDVELRAVATTLMATGVVTVLREDSP